MPRRDLEEFFSSDCRSFEADELSFVLAAKMMRRDKKGIHREADFWILERSSRLSSLEVDSAVLETVTVVKDELSDFLDDLMGFYDTLIDGSRFQILCSNNHHWLSIDICFVDGNFSIYLLDTTPVLERAVDIMFLLKQKLPIANLYYTCGPFQADGYNCAVIAYDHTCCLARITDLHDLLRTIHIKAPRKRTVGDFVLQYFDPKADTNERVTEVLVKFAEGVLQELSGSYLAEDPDAYNTLKEIIAEYHFMPVEWLTSDFAPLLRNTQRLKDYYPYFLRVNPELKYGRGGFTRQLSLEARVSRHQFFHEASLTMRTAAVDILRKKMKAEAQEFLAELSDEECAAIIAERKRSFSLPSIYFSSADPVTAIIFDSAGSTLRTAGG